MKGYNSENIQKWKTMASIQGYCLKCVSVIIAKSVNEKIDVKVVNKLWVYIDVVQFCICTLKHVFKLKFMMPPKFFLDYPANYMKVGHKK